MTKRLAALVVRLLLPLVILAIGWYGYSTFSVSLEEEPAEPAVAKKIRSRVQSLQTADYQVQIETHGTVGPHNLVTLSAEVTGRVETIPGKFDVGSYFKAGETLVEIDDRDYRTALRVAQEENRLADSTLKLAETAYKRLQQLVSRNSASRAELDIGMAELVNARSRVEITAAAIDQAERNLDRCKIVAPFDGRVVTRDIGLGQLISPGTQLGQIFAVDYAEIRLPISTRDLRYLNLPEMEGDPIVDVELRDSIDPNNDAVWHASIIRTEGTLDANSLELFAIARINDPFSLDCEKPILRIGQPVTATIRGETLKDVVAIPRDSVRRLDQIYLIDPTTKRLRSRTIRPLWSDEEFVVVRDEAIRPGDFLATTMLVYAPEGAEVDIIPRIETDSLAGAPAEGDPTP